MAQADESVDHRLVVEFFAARGLTAERIPESKTKTPDFRILRGAEVVAYCEVKSPQDVFPGRVADAIRDGDAGIIETGYGNDYRQARAIGRSTAKAATQFAAVNPTHSVPNILMLVNHDTASVYEDFQQAITGQIGVLGPGLVGKPVRDDFPDVDVYLWLDVSGRGDPSPRRLFNHNAPLKEVVRELLRLPEDTPPS